MFVKGFICGWIGMAAIVAVLIWGMTPREYGSADIFPNKPGYDAGYDYRGC